MTEKEILQTVFSKYELTPSELDKLHTHVEEHKYYLNENIPFEVTWDQAIFSWYDNIFRHVRNYFSTWIVRSAFPSLSTAEFYFQVMDHWHYLKKNSSLHRAYKPYLEDAIKSYVKNHAEKRLFGRIFSSFIQY